MRERVTTDQIKLARTVDLISYMQRYEPEELIRTGPHDYKTATHSSLCISDNGLWHWYSRGIGGRGALNYLIQVKGMDFVSAVRHLCELELPAHAPFQPVKKNPQHEYCPNTVFDPMTAKWLPLYTTAGRFESSIFFCLLYLYAVHLKPNCCVACFNCVRFTPSLPMCTTCPTSTISTSNP